jgi:hypothetical protein
LRFLDVPEEMNDEDSIPIPIPIPTPSKASGGEGQLDAIAAGLVLGQFSTYEVQALA